MADDEAPNWKALAQMDPTLAAMRSAGIPLTRENYISAHWGEPGTEDYPSEWTAEHEAQLPYPFQRG